jgi:hypothetical protein
MFKKLLLGAMVMGFVFSTTAIAQNTGGIGSQTTINAEEKYPVQPYRSFEPQHNFDESMCIANLTNRCVETICLNSERIDCELQCRRGARKQCEE